jgi:hypothetical protein
VTRSYSARDRLSQMPYSALLPACMIPTAFSVEKQFDTDMLNNCALNKDMVE